MACTCRSPTNTWNGSRRKKRSCSIGKPREPPTLQTKVVEEALLAQPPKPSLTIKLALPKSYRQTLTTNIGLSDLEAKHIIEHVMKNTGAEEINY